MMFYKIDSSGNTFIVLKSEKEIDINKYKNILDDVDGLVALYPSRSAKANFIIYNRDGSRAKMCGNGLIAATCYYKTIEKSDEDEFRFLTDSGYYNTKVEDENRYSVRFNKPKLIFASSKTGLIDSGNMHLVKLVDVINPSNMIDIQSVIDGPINIHQIQKSIDDVYMMASLENGVGFTKSCGTGCISSFAYLRKLDLCSESVLFKTIGGMIEVKEDENEYVLRGGAKVIYRGELYNE